MLSTVLALSFLGLFLIVFVYRIYWDQKRRDRLDNELKFYFEDEVRYRFVATDYTNEIHGNYDRQREPLVYQIAVFEDGLLVQNDSTSAFCRVFWLYILPEHATKLKNVTSRYQIETIRKIDGLLEINCIKYSGSKNLTYVDYFSILIKSPIDLSDFLTDFNRVKRF